MVRLSESRKNFRFPAYDDNEGVKLNRKRRRDFLKDVLNDDFVYDSQRKDKNKRNLIDMDKVDMAEDPVYFGTDQLDSYVKKATPNRPRPVAAQVSKPHEDSSPFERPTRKDEQHRYESAFVDPKERYRAPEASYANRFYETNEKGSAKHQLPVSRRRKFESSYRLPGEPEKKAFEPKYIPVSMIEATKQGYSNPKKEELKHQIKKRAQDQFMTMDTTSMTDNHSNNTEEQLLSKKNNRLDKSLSGIMKDEGSKPFDNAYFD